MRSHSVCDPGFSVAAVVPVLVRVSVLGRGSDPRESWRAR